ncbi:MAG TPA: hypothetical protein VMS56_04000 [Thermoanaerobaculia bacterium]|nr:hypothetical protein [Thermoanaerobaculia bacterium]
MRDRGARLLAAGLILLACAAVSGRLFFYWRDNFSTHLPYRAVLASSLVPPLWNPAVGGGQPLAGNPNALAFYPDSVLYLALPLFVAFNLHFLLHWLGGAVAMGALARRRGLSPELSRFAGALWLLSGAAISALAFYNLSTAVLLVPLALLAAERASGAAGAREIVMLGGVFGLIGLAGEPVTALGTALAALILVAGRIRWWRVAAAVPIALVIASPLLVAWSEIAAEVERGMRAYSAETVLAASLSPWQAVEMLLGPVRGLASDLSAGGLAASGAAGAWPPLLVSVMLGAIALPAMVSPPRALRREWIAAIVLFALALGRFNPVVEGVVRELEWARLLRYPEKLAIPASALLALLIAGWLGKPARSRGDVVAAWGGVALAAGLAIAALGAGGWSAAMRERTLLGALVAATSFAIALTPVSRARAVLLATVTIVPLAAHAALAIPLDRLEPYRRPPMLAEPLAGMRIAREIDPLLANAGFDSARERYRAAAAAIDPVWGSAFGVRYALDRSPDGMYSLLSRIAHERFAAGDAARKARWAALAACDAIVSDRPLDDPRLVPRASMPLAARRIHVYGVERALPYLIAPRRVVSVPHVNAAVDLLESPEFDPHDTALAPPGWEREGRIAVIGSSPVRWGLLVEIDASEPGAIVVNESWFRAWRARDQGGRELATFPANLDRLGVAVPAGTRRVELTFGRRRAAIAAAALASWITLVVSIAAWGLPRRPRSGPASSRAS